MSLKERRRALIIFLIATLAVVAIIIGVVSISGKASAAPNYCTYCGNGVTETTIPATCEQPAKKIRRCNDTSGTCGKVVWEETIGEALGHQWENYIPVRIWKARKTLSSMF